MAEAVYLMCALTSLACAALLLRNYWSSRVRLILWTSLCFVGLAINNMLLYVDLAVVSTVDLRIWRVASELIAVCVLLYGMIESEHRGAQRRWATPSPGLGASGAEPLQSGVRP